MHKNNFSVKDLIIFGWSKTLSSYVYILQVMVFSALVLYISRTVGSFIGGLIMLCLGVSLTTVFLMISRGQKTVFSDLFKKYKGYEIFLNYILASIVFGFLLSLGLSLVVIALFIMGIFGYLPTVSLISAGNIFALIILAILTIPGIYLIIRLQFYKFFIIDKDMGPIPALKASWKITKGHFWKLVQYLLAIVLINIIVGLFVNKGGIIFLVLLLVTVPVVAIASARLYEMLSGEF